MDQEERSLDSCVDFYGLGMDALSPVCSWNMDGIMVWAWMLKSPYARGTRPEL